MTDSVDMDEWSDETREIVKGGVGEFEPRLEPLRARGELALGHIRISRGLDSRSNQDPDHDLEIHQRFGELQAPEGWNPDGKSM